MVQHTDLAHTVPDGSEWLIAYALQTLTTSERNYAQLEKEALALIFGIKKFHKYLFGRKFTLVTEHKPPITILGPKKAIPPLATARLQRSAVLLSAYDYTLEFKPSQCHSKFNADGLSRLPLKTTAPATYSSEPPIFNISQLKLLQVTAASVQSLTKTDPLLSKVLRYTKHSWLEQIPAALQPFYARQNELALKQNCLFWGIWVTIPK